MQGFPLAGYYQNTNQNTKSTIVSLENGFWDRLKAGVDIWYAVGEQVSGRRADRLPWLPVAWVHLHLGHHRMVEVVHEITCTQNLFELENYLNKIILFGEVQSGVWALTKFLGNVNIWSSRRVCTVHTMCSKSKYPNIRYKAWAQISESVNKPWGADGGNEGQMHTSADSVHAVI